MNKSFNNQRIKLIFVADTHHFSSTLTDEKRSFMLRSESDQKCLIETGSIIDSAFDAFANSDADAIMIAGDLTDNGELVSHYEFLEKLHHLSEKRSVFVTTSTHDWCSDNKPRAYFGDSVADNVKVAKASELSGMYYDFGLKQSISKYTNDFGLCSYVVDISESLRLLAINDDQDGKGHSGYSDEHLDWIISQIKEADSLGKTIIGMEHHLIMPHIHPLLSGFGMRIGDCDDRASKLADAGLKYIFTGHSHIQRISHFISKNGNTITQINLGSLVGFPGNYAEVSIEAGNIDVKFKHTDYFDFHGQQQTVPYLKSHLIKMVDVIVDAASENDTNEFKDRALALGIKMNHPLFVHKLVKPLAKWIKKARVCNAYRILNFITFGKVIKKEWAKAYWNEPIMSFVHTVICDAIGGCDSNDHDEIYCNLVTSVLSVPSFFVKGNKVLNEIPGIAKAILTGKEWSNY